MQTDPEAAVSRDLSAAERSAIIAGDVGTLYPMGAVAFLLSDLTRFDLFALTVPVYSARRRAAALPVSNEASTLSPGAVGPAPR